MSHGWLRPDPVAATKDVILPVGGGLLAMIVLPALLFQIIRYIFPNVMVDDKFVCEYEAPSLSRRFCRYGILTSHFTSRACLSLHIYNDRPDAIKSISQRHGRFVVTSHSR